MTVDDQYIDYDLISSVVAGFALDEDVEKCLLLCAINPNFKSEFIAYESVWIKTGALQGKKIVDSDKAWNALKKKKLLCNHYEMSEMDAKPSFFNLSVFLKFVAVFTVAVAVLFYFRNSQSSDFTVFSHQNKLNGLLPDSTSFLLYEGSELWYSTNFNSANRSITVSGKASFEVAGGLKKKFNVTTPSFVADVEGALFLIEDYPLAQESRIVVQGTAIVEYNHLSYYIATGKGLLIHKGGDAPPKIVALDENDFAWKTKRLVFVNSPLEYVVEQISQTYGVVVDLEVENSRNCTVTATFDNVALHSLLAVLHSLLNVEIKQVGQKIVLSVESCE